MYLTNFEEIKNETGVLTKVGKVNVERFRNNFRLRFTVNSKRYSLTIDGGITKESYQVAIGKASLINGDIALDKFDSSLVAYDPKRGQMLEAIADKAITTEAKQLNLKDIWELYKEAKRHSVEKTTVKKWQSTNNVLTKLTNEQLSLEVLENLTNNLIKFYSVSTLERVYTDLHASLNWAKDNKKIDWFPNLKSQLPKKQKSNRSKEAFTIEDIERILKAFKENEFKLQKSIFEHSYYTEFIAFIAFTGCRPEDAIALEWTDIIEQNGRKLIKFSKAYSKGILKSTKNNTVRLFPINQQLEKILTTQKVISGKEKLVFPSRENSYIDLHNFTNRYWRKVVKPLADNGEITRYLPLYNLRHTFATYMIRQGVDLASIASLIESSIEMLSQHYLDGNSGITLPEIK